VGARGYWSQSRRRCHEINQGGFSFRERPQYATFFDGVKYYIFANKENCMARVKILFVTIFVLSLFLMCGGCESERREQRDDRQEELRDRQSEHEQSDRYREKEYELQEQQHEERH